MKSTEETHGTASETKPPAQLWVRVTPSGGTISYTRKPFDVAGPVYVYRLVEQAEPGDIETVNRPSPIQDNDCPFNYDY